MATWKCPNCDELWPARIKTRVLQRNGCPHCYALRIGHKADGTRTSHPTLQANGQNQHPVMSEWDWYVNETEGFSPDKIKLGSSKLVSWVCHRCSMGHLHRFKARPCNRTQNNSGCPYCSSHKACECNSLQTWFPEAIEEWDSNKNEGTPADFASRSCAVVWWNTAKRGSWQQSIDGRAHAWLRQRQRKLAKNLKALSGMSGALSAV